ncbi:phosphotransferase [Actinospica durhamensis]|uniref:phosphotransferase n=1 Tax=Actinospica durhamensis TaxID=1508375 RepID=UPI001BA8CF04|nr:phosphotransferase [Actinospica durhamensis]
MTVPGRDVLDAFELAGSPVVLAGGEGRSVRVGDVVLKPADGDLQAAEWLARTMACIPEEGFRISRPLHTADGAWIYHGWTASRYVPGAEPDHGAAPRWLEIIAAGRAFHRVLAGLPRPDFLDRRSNWWETGSKVAWQERGPDLIAGFHTPYMELSALLVSPPGEQPQLIHGDLTGNVLFAPGLAPAVIENPPTIWCCSGWVA